MGRYEIKVQNYKIWGAALRGTFQRVFPKLKLFERLGFNRNIFRIAKFERKIKHDIIWWGHVNWGPKCATNSLKFLTTGVK